MYLTVAFPIIGADGNQLAISDILTKHYSPADGLPHRSVTALFQCQEGFIWIGTQSGLSRFDGIQFERISSAQHLKLSDVYVTAIRQDANGSIWIGTRGHGVFVLSDDRIWHLTSNDGLPGNIIHDISINVQGEVWIAAEHGLAFWNNELKPIDIPGIEGRVITALCWQGYDAFWLGTTAGLFRGTRLPGRQFSAKPVWKGPITVLTCDAEGRVWFGTKGQGLYCMADGVLQNIGGDGLPSNWHVRCFKQTDQDTVWVGTDSSGVFHVEDGVCRRFSMQMPVASKRIFAIMEDHEGSLWVGTHMGLTHMQRSFFSTLSTFGGLSSQLVWSVFAHDDGRVLFGTEGGGLNVLEDGVFRYYQERHGLASNDVLAAIIARDDALWVGTRDGLNRIRQGTIDSFHQSDGLIDTYIRCLFEDRQGIIWIGTRNGVSRFSQGRFDNHSKSNGLVGNAIRCFCETSENSVWIGTDSGLSCYENGRFTNYTTAQGLTDQFIRSIHQDRHGDVWVGTYGGGICRFNGQEFQAITSQDGLFHDVIFQIFSDATDCFWFATHQGVFRSPRSQLNAFLDGRLRRIECDVFGGPNDVSPIEYTGGVFPSGAQDTSGRIWFPTFDGAVIFDPLKPKPNSLPPLLAMKRILVDGKDVAPSSSIEMRPENEKIEFQFAALTYQAPGKVRYFYQLQGLDQEWVDAGNRRSAFYNNLPPNDYVFRVKAQNHDSVWSEDNLAVQVSVRPHFFQTASFAAMVGVSLFLLGYFVRQQRMRAVKRRQQELEKEVDLRTKDLQVANRELGESSEILRNTQQQLVHAAHQAGMAEVASEVLHHVGNALNTMKVSSSLIGSRIEITDDSFPSRLAGLIERESTTPSWTEERASQAARLLAEFSQRLLKTKTDISDETMRLDRQIDLIHRVVWAQKEVTPRARIVESVNVGDVIRDVISLYKVTCDKQRIDLVEDLQVVADLKLERFKIYQVLINLFNNAIEAVVHVEPDQGRRIAIGLHQNVDAIIIRVQDNGEGIDSAAFGNIFSLGYSTKENRSGFGLHYCGNVIQEMGADIRVRSSGPNQGATFELLFPLRLKSSPT